MKKMLTTKQAWEKIAEAYTVFANTGRKPGHRRDGFYKVGAVGLCGAITTLWGSGQITWGQKVEMGDEVDAALDEMRHSDLMEAEGGVRSITLAEYDRDGAALRAALATIYAEEAADVAEVTELL